MSVETTLIAITPDAHDYKLDDLERNINATARAAVGSLLRGEVTIARMLAINFAQLRDGRLTLDEGGIHWVLERSPFADFVTARAREAGEWVLSLTEPAGE